MAQLFWGLDTPAYLFCVACVDGEVVGQLYLGAFPDRLYKKFGFSIEGTMSRCGYRDGQYVDAYMMARLRTVDLLLTHRSANLLSLTRWDDQDILRGGRDERAIVCGR